MLLRQTILYLPAQFLGPLVQFLSVIVWTHWLTPASFGELMLITVSHELAYAVSLSWFSLYAVRYMPPRDDQKGRARFYRTEASVIAASSLFAAATALFVLYLVFDHPPSLLLLGATLGYFISRSVNLHMSERVRADEEILNYTLLQTLGPVFGFLLGLVFMAQYEPAPWAVLVAYMLAQFAGSLLVYWRTETSFDIARPDEEMIRGAVKYGAPIMLANWLGWFSDHGIRFIVKYGIDLAAVGLMSVAWGLGRRSTAFATNLVSAAAFPLVVKRFNDGNRAEAMRQLAKNGALMFGVLAPAVAGIWCINELLVRVLIDRPFQQATIELLPLAVLAGGIRNYRQHYIDHVFLLDGKTRLFIYLDSFEAVMVLLLSGSGLWLAGLYGAVAGAMLGTLAGALAAFALALREGGFILPLGHLSRIALACTAMALVLVVLPLPVSPLGLAGGILIGAITYFGALAPFYWNEVEELAKRRGK